MRLIILTTIALSLLSGCASSPDKISAKHVSPLKYKNNSCKELCTEIRVNTNRKQALFSNLKQKADRDAVQAGVGAVLFWPALFMLEGGDGPDATEYSEIKGNEKAILEAQKLKDCKTIAHNQKLTPEMMSSDKDTCQLPDFSEKVKKTEKLKKSDE